MRPFSLAFGSVVGIGAIGLVLTVSAASGRKLISKAPLEAGKAELKNVLPRAIPSRLAPVERHPVSHPIHATGQIRAKSQIDLGFLVGGEVTWVGVDVGTKVRRGQVLARLDETQIAADADRARAAVVQAQRDLDRVLHLEASGAVPAAMLESAQTGYAIATAQQRSADFALRHGTLLSPDDGVIDARLIERGQTVGPGQPTVRLSGKGRGAVVRTSLSDRDVIGLEVGRRARVRLDALGDESFAAKVAQIAPATSPGSGAFEVEIRLDTPPREYKSGMTAKIEIDRVVPAGCIVPVSALVPGDRDGASVVAVTDGIAHRLPVHVLFLEGDIAALKEPLTGVKDVATLGAGMLGDGAPVLVVQP
jgi:multidrug efflux system membrane fusion protein